MHDAAAGGAGWGMARALPATAAALLLLAACSSSDTSGGSAGADTSPPTAAGTTAPPSSPAPGDAATTSTTVAGGAPTSAGAAPAPDLGNVAVQLTEIGSFDQPIAIVDRDGVFYVAEQAGRVLTMDVDGGTPREVLDMTDRTTAGGEQGLLDLAFSPDGRHLYVSYTNNDGDSRIDEYATSADGVDTSTRREVLAIDQPYANHNGG